MNYKRHRNAKISTFFCAGFPPSLFLFLLLILPLLFYEWNLLFCFSPSTKNKEKYSCFSSFDVWCVCFLAFCRLLLYFTLHIKCASVCGVFHSWKKKQHSHTRSQWKTNFSYIQTSLSITYYNSTTVSKTFPNFSYTTYNFPF